MSNDAHLHAARFAAALRQARRPPINSFAILGVFFLILLAGHYFGFLGPAALVAGIISFALHKHNRSVVSLNVKSVMLQYGKTPPR